MSDFKSARRTLAQKATDNDTCPCCGMQPAQPSASEGERVEQDAIVKLREALGNLMRIYQLPDNEWNQPSPGQFFRDAQKVYEETARLVPTRGGADHD